jgi:hypothetical protein
MYKNTVYKTLKMFRHYLKMLIQTRVYLVVTSPFVNLLVLVSWFCIVGSYLNSCVLLFCECPLCAVRRDCLSCDLSILYPLMMVFKRTETYVGVNL